KFLTVDSSRTDRSRSFDPLNEAAGVLSFSGREVGRFRCFTEATTRRIDARLGEPRHARHALRRTRRLTTWERKLFSKIAAPSISTSNACAMVLASAESA